MIPFQAKQKSSHNVIITDSFRIESCLLFKIDVHNVLIFNTGELMFLNEATLLNNIVARYRRDKIYVSSQLLFYSSHIPISIRFSYKKSEL